MKTLIEDIASTTVQKILEEKIKIEASGKVPRVVLVSEDIFKLLEENWLEGVSDLPWGDSISYEVEKRRREQGTVFLGDATLFGLWLVKVNTIEGFKGLPHRLEFVAEVGRIFFYNDSKATNVDSVVRALEALDPPLILIAGGKDKGGDYRPLIPAIKQKVKALILVGEAKEKMQNIFKSTTTTVMAETLEEAFNLSLKHAAAGDTVLLSPACSSFDMFSSYEERGNLFKALVTKLAGRNNKKNGNKQGI